MTFTVAIVGLGQVGLTYDSSDDAASCLSHSQAFAMHHQFTLIAGVDPRPESRLLFEERYSARTFESLADLAGPLTQPIDVIVIATPAGTHPDLLREVAQVLTPRLVLLEKPAAGDSSAAREMATLAEHPQPTVALNYPRRVTPGSLFIRDQVDASNGPLHATCRYVGELITQGIHMIDLCESWFGELQSAEVVKNVDSASPSFSAVFERGTANFLSLGCFQDRQIVEYSAQISSPDCEWAFDVGRDRRARSRTQGTGGASGVTVPIGFEMYQYWVANEVARLLESGTSNLADLHAGLRHVEIVEGLVKRGSWP